MAKHETRWHHVCGVPLEMSRQDYLDRVSKDYNTICPGCKRPFFSPEKLQSKNQPVDVNCPYCHTHYTG